MDDGAAESFEADAAETVQETPREVYNKPATKFVAGFMGSPTINFLKGKVEELCKKAEKLKADLEAAGVSTPVPQ